MVEKNMPNMTEKKDSANRIPAGEQLHQTDGGLLVDPKRRRLMQLLGASSVYAFAGCAAPDLDEEQDSATIALSEDPTRNRDPELYGGLSPYTIQVLQNLTIASPDLSEIRPVMATDWEATDETTWEFTLREGVTFHNGVDLTAEVVEESLTGLLEQSAYPWADIDEESFTAVDELTLEIETTQPSPFLPGNLAHPALKVHYRGDEGGEGPIGTGPYETGAVEEGEVITTTAYDEYWGETPTFEELVFDAIEDDTTRTTALEAGEVDVAMNLPPQQFDRLDEDPEVDLHPRQQPRTVLVPMNIHKPPTDDRQLRLALQYAVDQESIVENILDGIGTPALGPFAPILDWSAHDELPEYGPDMDRARELVEESDYDGEEMTMVVSSGNPDRQQMAELMQSRFGEIGVEVEIQILEPATYLDRFIEGDVNLVLVSFGSYSGATDYLIPVIFHTESFLNIQQYQEEGTGVLNLGEEFDEQLDDATTTWDEEERHEKYREIQHRVMDEAIMIPLLYREYTMGARDHISAPDEHAIAIMTDWLTMDTA